MTTPTPIDDGGPKWSPPSITKLRDAQDRAESAAAICRVVGELLVQFGMERDTDAGGLLNDFENMGAGMTVIGDAIRGAALLADDAREAIELTAHYQEANLNEAPPNA